MPRGKFCGIKTLLKTTKEAFFALLMPIIIIGGILSGIFTPTEAGVVACVYGILYGLVKKSLTRSPSSSAAATRALPLSAA